MDREVQAIVYRTRADDFYRVGRTMRSLEAAGIRAGTIGDLTGRSLRKILGSGRPVLFLRAGTWLADAERYSNPLPSATGKGLCAFGAIRSPGIQESRVRPFADQWKDLWRATGGDFSRLSDPFAHLAFFFQEPAALFLDEVASTTLADAGVSSFEEIAEIACRRFRLVHYPPLDVRHGAAIRVLQVITALQRGGAERVTLDLVAELPAHGVAVQLATLGRARRQAFPTPPGTIELGRASPTARRRSESLEMEAISFGADVIHGHLLSRGEACRLAAAGFPVVLTLHNTREGWPAGTTELQSGDAALLVGCARAVENEARAAHLPVAIRTVRNGIDIRHFRPTPQSTAAGRDWRKRWGFGEQDLVLIAIANPRPQKQLHLLPQVLAALRQLLCSDREARLVLCGEAIPGKPDTEECVRRTRSEIARHGLEPHVRWVGSTSEIRDLLSAADVLVSTSLHEGLSLAQLEALAMGLHVVASDVGGAHEIAWNNPDFHLVPSGASPEAYARIVAELAKAGRTERGNRFPEEHWSSQSMAASYARLYPRAIASTSRRSGGTGLWLITNNFSTGGAQSSARRLLSALADEGENVRAATVEEYPDNPTPGRQQLAQAGIPVLALSPDLAAEHAVGQLLAAIDIDSPQAVVFWNLRPEFKVLLAEALFDARVFDVSPGEMFFSALERYFKACPPGRPIRTITEYGSRLAGAIVKYQAECARAQSALGRPVEVIANGVPVPEVPVSWHDHTGTVVFGTAARIHPQKRLEDLIVAFRLMRARCPGCALVIAGGVERGCESYAAELVSMSRDLPVTWLGEITEMKKFHETVDIFVMISEPAGCPNASLEAMASGLPVVATDVGGASEQVVDQITGRLVAPRDPIALATAMAEMARNPEVWLALGSAGRDHIQARFSLKRMIADYQRILFGGDRKVI